jgi:hypothetical protein
MSEVLKIVTEVSSRLIHIKKVIIEQHRECQYHMTQTYINCTNAARLLHCFSRIMLFIYSLFKDAVKLEFNFRFIFHIIFKESLLINSSSILAGCV